MKVLIRMFACLAWCASPTLFASQIGCGGNEGSGGSGGAGGGSGGTPTLKIATWWLSGGEQEALSTALTLFTESNDANIEVVPLSQDNAVRKLEFRDLAWDIGQENYGSVSTTWCQFQTEPFPGGAPSTFCETEDGPGSNPVGYIVEDLNQISALDNELASIPSTVKDVLTHQGEMLSFPMNIHRENTLHYSKALTTPPTTVAELAAFCDNYKACVADDPGSCGDYAYGTTGNRPKPLAMASASWINRIWFNGMLPPDVVARAAADPVPSMVEALTLIRDFYANDCLWIAPIDADGVDWHEHRWDKPVEAVINGEALMYIHGDWAKGLMVQSEGWDPGIDFEVAPSPGSEGAFYYGVDVFGLNAVAEKRDLGVKFIEFALSEPVQIAFSEKKGSTPSIPITNPATSISDPTLLNSYNDLVSARSENKFILAPSWISNHGDFVNRVIDPTVLQPGTAGGVPVTGAQGLSPECIARVFKCAYEGQSNCETRFIGYPFATCNNDHDDDPSTPPVTIPDPICPSEPVDECPTDVAPWPIANPSPGPACRAPDITSSYCYKEPG